MHHVDKNFTNRLLEVVPGDVFERCCFRRCELVGYEPFTVIRCCIEHHAHDGTITRL